MLALKGILVGLWRAVESPGLVVWLWLVSLVFALPAGVAMTGAIRSSIGGSLVHEQLAAGFDMGWYGEFQEEAKGVEKTFTPTLLGAGAFYNNLEALLYGDLFKQFPPGLIGLGILYALLWALFVGGILDRFTNPAGLFRLRSFFPAGGRFFFRFVRLAVLAGVLYFLVYRFAGWLYQRIAYLTRDVTVEGTVLTYTLLGTALVVILMTVVNMAFDYAKIATFVEDRRSMLLAALRGFRFVFSHPGTTMGVYYGFGILGIVLLGLYAFVAPGAGQSTVTGVVLAFLIGQAYLIAKLMLRLAFYGGQMAVYEGVMTSSQAPAETDATEEAGAAES